MEFPNMVSLPFDFCGRCRYLEIEEARLYNGAEIAETFRSCRYRGLCQSTATFIEKQNNEKEKHK